MDKTIYVYDSHEMMEKYSQLGSIQGKNKTKIICTLGPSSCKADTIASMLEAGMNIARINLAYGNLQQYSSYIKELKAAMKIRSDKVCSIMIDTKGPAITTGVLKDHQPIQLQENQSLTISDNPNLEGDTSNIACSDPIIIMKSIIGSKILISDASIECIVKEKNEHSLNVIVKRGGILRENRNIHIFGTILGLPAITKEEEITIKEACLNFGVDIIALSFTSSPDDVKLCADILGTRRS